MNVQFSVLGRTFISFKLRGEQKLVVLMRTVYEEGREKGLYSGIDPSFFERLLSMKGVVRVEFEYDCIELVVSFLERFSSEREESEPDAASQTRNLLKQIAGWRLKMHPGSSTVQ